jgi:hypothetical protein
MELAEPRSAAKLRMPRLRILALGQAGLVAQSCEERAVFLREVHLHGFAHGPFFEAFKL